MPENRDRYIRIELNRRQFVCLAALLLVLYVVKAVNTESLTMTTAYPSPAGIYKNLTTTQETLLSRDGGNVGVGTPPNPPSRLTVQQGSDSQSLGPAGLRLINTARTGVTQLLTGGDNNSYFFNGTGNNYVMLNTAGNLGILSAPNPSSPNGQPGNMDANDVFLRSTGKWASQGAGIFPLTAYQSGWVSGPMQTWPIGTHNFCVLTRMQFSSLGACYVWPAAAGGVGPGPAIPGPTQWYLSAAGGSCIATCMK